VSFNTWIRSAYSSTPLKSGPEILLEERAELGADVRHAGSESGHQPGVEGQQVAARPVHGEERLHEAPPVHLRVVRHAELGRRGVDHLAVHTVGQLS
jgi:hypothetical protein